MVSSLYSLLQRQPLDTYITQPLQSNQLQDFGYLPDSKFHSHTNGGVYVDLGAKIDNGVVWFWLLEKWQDLPNELWAWKYVTVWTAGHYHFGRSIWLPSLLLFDFWEYDRSSYLLQKWASNPQAVTPIVERQPVVSATSLISPRLFKLLRSSGDSRLARTCRLVCRDWASECAVRRPQDWRIEDGVIWHWVETAWQVLPSRLWAWTLGPMADEWWVEERCHQRCLWCPKLLHPVGSGSIDRSSNYPSTLALPLSTSGTFRQSRFLTATTLPPELFQYICNAADGGSWPSRLVCRYWNRQCTPRVLRQIDVNESPERIRTLWKHRADPTLVRHLAVIKNVPCYDGKSKFPWIHLLTQTSTSTQSVWKDTCWGTSGITITGPFPGGHRTMRSVHFDLPRSPPRALSRGIKKLFLGHLIHIRRFEDLLHMVCELPDLEELASFASFDSLPTELPRRRPRTNRDKLRECSVSPSGLSGPSPKWIDGMLSIALYMSVYDAASFFSEAEVIPILAVLKGMHTPVFFALCYSHDPQHHSRTLDFVNNESLSFLALHTLRDGESHVHTTLKIGVDCRYKYLREVEPEEGWEQEYWADWKCTDADAKFRENTAPLRHARFALGFYDRRQLKHFVKTVLEEDPPAIFRDATLRYGVWDENAVEAGAKDRFGRPAQGAWRQASLDSEDLTGKPRRRLPELYL